MESSKTYTKTQKGTIEYMAPELLKEENFNNKVDIWPFGCIVYELFTLNKCFESETLLGLINKVINENHGKIDSKKYCFEFQELIDLLLKKIMKKGLILMNY